MRQTVHNFIARGDTLLAAAEYETLGRHLDGILQIVAEISSHEELAKLRERVRHWEEQTQVHKAALHKRLRAQMTRPNATDSYRQVAAAS